MKIGHENGRVGWAKLGEHLATGAARVQRFCGIGDHNHSGYGPSSFRDGFEDGGPFSAVGKSETGVFDICAGEDESVCEYRCADMESRVRGVGLFSSGNGVGEEIGDARGMIHGEGGGEGTERLRGFHGEQGFFEPSGGGHFVSDVRNLEEMDAREAFGLVSLLENDFCVGSVEILV